MGHITTHTDLFKLDKLPLVDVDSTLGQLLLANAHRAAGGPCRTRSHTKYHLRSCPQAAYLTGPLERRLTKMMSVCVPCRKRKIEIKDGELTCYSPHMKTDRFKSSTPFPFSKICADTIGPLKVSLQTAGVSTRKVSRFAEHHILVVCCIAGSGAVRYIQIPSTNSDAFALGLQRLIAFTGRPPLVVFTDLGSGLVSAAKKEQTRAQAAKETEEVVEESKIDEKLIDRFPGITFESAKSSEQFKNGKCEIFVKAYKLFVRDVLFLKPGARMPEFTVLGLDLLCEEASRIMCSRPIAYLGDQDLVLTPNSFLLAGMSDSVWGTEGELPTKYLELQEYRARMYDRLREMMVNCDFSPKKWSHDERMPKVGDICLMARQRGKLSQVLEYARVLAVEDDGRELKLRVCRSKSGNVKEINGSSRNAHLVFRPDTDK